MTFDVTYVLVRAQLQCPLSDTPNVDDDPFRNITRRRRIAFEERQLRPADPEIVEDLSDSLHNLFRPRRTMKLIGADQLKELDVHAVDMNREIEKVFTKYETFFGMNGLGKTDPDDEAEIETNEHKRMKANVPRQYIGDAALEAIWPDPTDRSKSYEQLQDRIIKKLKPKVSETLVRGQFFRSVMTEGQTSRDFLQELWQAIRRTSCTNRDISSFPSSHA